jgi:hypothetical protein
MPIFRVKQGAKQTVLGLHDPKDEDAAMCTKVFRVGIFRIPILWVLT